MPDNILLSTNIGTGETLATELEGSAHYQKIKLVASGNGTTADLSRAEDAAHISGEHGIMALSVRKNTAASTSGTDGDYQPLITDTNGRLHTIDVSTLAALSGNEFQVDIVAALPAGTNAIGKLSANSGVDIGDVDVTSVLPGTGASNLGKAEDAAHSTGDVGVAAMSVRANTAVSLSGADNDYQPLITDTNGRLHVNDVSTTAALSGNEFQVDIVAALPAGTNGIGKLTANSGVDIGDVDVTTVIPGTAATNLGKAEDAAHSSGDVGVAAMTVRSDTAAALSGDDNDYQPLITDGSGRLHVNDVSTAAALSGSEFQVDVVAALPAGTNAIGKLAANSGVDIGDVDVTTIIPGTGATNLGKAEDESHSSGDVGVAAMTVRANTATSLSGADNDYQPLITDTNGRLHVIDVSTASALSGSEFQVDVVASLPAGTNAIGKLAANSGVDIGDVDITSISAGSNLIGDVGISGTRTSGGTTLYRNIDVDESEDEVKGSAGQIYWIHAMNLSSSVRYLQIYNATAASVTVGSTTADLTFPLLTSGNTNGAGFVLTIPAGIAFGTAITIAATTDISGSGAPGANEVFVNLGFA